MTSRRGGRRRDHPPGGQVTVGLIGLFGRGNLGNDASLEAMLGYLEAEHPDARLDVMCSQPDRLTERYGIAASHLSWYSASARGGTRGLLGKCLGTGLGIGIDAVRIGSWVRRHDVVIVPGMGVLEATLPLRPWQTPYWMFLTCLSGRLFGTRVALVSVGANVIAQRLTRRLVVAAARRAHYRSYRDTGARYAMRAMGLDTSADPVYPDLAFALRPPGDGRPDAAAVGVGIMDYSGGNDDRRVAGQICSSYVDTMTRFVCWLADSGRTVRLLAGDTQDHSVIGEILAQVRTRRPELGRHAIQYEPASSISDLMRQLRSVATVVATRYHTVLCALMMGRPTLAVGYAAKFDALMADMGLADFCQPARSADFGLLIEQFTALQSQSELLSQRIAERTAANRLLLRRQFAELTAALFPHDQGRSASADPRPVQIPAPSTETS